MATRGDAFDTLALVKRVRLFTVELRTGGALRRTVQRGFTMKCLSSRTLMAFVAITTVTLSAGQVVGIGVASQPTQGYTWSTTPSAAAINPAGLNVYVVKGSRAAAVTPATTYAVSQQQRYGVRVR